MDDAPTTETGASGKDRATLERHPLSAAWTDMPEREHVALREDIRKRGVLEPITLLDGKVLDGWHRYTAAKAIDPEYDVPAVDLADRDPADFVISRNLHRRHLTAAQRAVCVLQVRSWKGRGRPSAGEAGPEERTREWTNQELAEEAGCSVSLISAVKREMLKGRGNDIKEGRESIASLRAKGAAERPPTPTEKLRAEVADLREQNAAMAKELTRLREAAEPRHAEAGCPRQRPRAAGPPHEPRTPRDLMTGHAVRIGGNPRPVRQWLAARTAIEAGVGRVLLEGEGLTVARTRTSIQPSIVQPRGKED